MMLYERIFKNKKLIYPLFVFSAVFIYILCIVQFGYFNVILMEKSQIDDGNSFVNASQPLKEFVGEKSNHIVAAENTGDCNFIWFSNLRSFLDEKELICQSDEEIAQMFYKRDNPEQLKCSMLKLRYLDGSEERYELLSWHDFLIKIRILGGWIW